MGTDKKDIIFSEVADYIRVFTYGTLRINQGNYSRCIKNTKEIYEGETSVSGMLMVLDDIIPMIYPTIDKSRKIIADSFLVTFEVFCRLDRLEGYPYYYNRIYIKDDKGNLGYIYTHSDYSERDKIQSNWIINQPDFVKSGDYLEARGSY